MLFTIIFAAALLIIIFSAKHFHDLGKPLPHCIIKLYNASNYFSPLCQLC